MESLAREELAKCELHFSYYVASSKNGFDSFPGMNPPVADKASSRCCCSSHKGCVEQRTVALHILLKRSSLHLQQKPCQTTQGIQHVVYSLLLAIGLLIINMNTHHHTTTDECDIRSNIMISMDIKRMGCTQQKLAEDSIGITTMARRKCIPSKIRFIHEGQQQQQYACPATNALDSLILYRQRTRNRRLLDKALVEKQKTSIFGNGCDDGNSSMMTVDFDSIVRDLRYTIDETIDTIGSESLPFPRIEWNSEDDDDLLTVPCPTKECLTSSCTAINPIKGCTSSRSLTTKKRVAITRATRTNKRVKQQIARSNKIASKMNLCNPNVQMFIPNTKRMMIKSPSPNKYSCSKRMNHHLKRLVNRSNTY